MLDQKMKDYRFETSSENVKLMQLDWNLFLKHIVQMPSPRKFKVQASASALFS